jgi:plasmid stability protein
VARDSGPSILVRGLDPKTVQRLRAQARVNGRSLEQEILERAARMLTMREAGKPVGCSRVAAGEGHAGLPWGGRGNHEKVLRTAYAPRAG